MVCGGCVQKLAARLVENHKLDWIHALTLAYKGMERVSHRVKKGVEGKDDYTQDCVGSTPSHPQYCGSQTCRFREPVYCMPASYCTGTCTCPDPSDPHSHQVRDGCSCDDCCVNYGLACPEGCACLCNGTCGYDCDDGYVWDPVLEECVLSAKKPVGDGLTFTV